jgi:hypothetical protein
MMQDIDQILAEGARHAAAAGSTWNAFAKCSATNMLREQTLPGFSRQAAA